MYSLCAVSLLRSNCVLSLVALHHTKLMDQHAGAQHMKPIYFKGCLHSLCSTSTHTHTHIYLSTHNIKLKRMRACWRHFSIRLTRGTTEMGENGQSIIISREEPRWRGKKATVLSLRCQNNKIRPCVIHLWPWHSAPQPPTTISVVWDSQSLFLAFLCLFNPKFSF